MSREESDEKKLLDQSREYVQKQVAVGGLWRRSRWKRKFGSELEDADTMDAVKIE